jgi:hypothetical protein
LHRRVREEQEEDEKDERLQETETGTSFRLFFLFAHFVYYRHHRLVSSRNSISLPVRHLQQYGIMASFDTFRGQARPAFGRERTWERARTLALSALVGLGRRTVTGMLSASGQIGMDWSAALPEGNGSHRARGIPIDLTHCPLPKKPWRNAPPPAWEEYGDLQKTMKVSAVGVDRSRRCVPP